MNRPHASRRKSRLPRRPENVTLQQALRLGRERQDRPRQRIEFATLY
jgi:hypothetical protein